MQKPSFDEPCTEKLPGSMTIDFAGESFCLLPDRAIWWSARQTLILSDVHLGKGAAFRKAGVPVPSGGSEKDLRRIDVLLAATRATRLVILGDLVHAKNSHQPELFASVQRWRVAHAAIDMLLVRGNHDRFAGRLPTEWNVPETDELTEDFGLLLAHHPRHDQTRPVLAGHIHPVIVLRDHDRSTVRVPCFVFDEKCCAVLPAFGSFTGGHPTERIEGRRIFLTSGKRVVAVK